MDPVHDFDKLTDDDQAEMVRLIAKDNLEHSNQFYPEARVKNGIYNRFVKRFIDIIISSFALILFFPINLAIGIVTFFDVGAPIFFKQRRMGYKAEEFTMVKFRNMTNEVDENGVLLRADLRVTRWGRFVRST